MSWRERWHHYLVHPSASRVGWINFHIVMGLLLVNICIMACETLDGPRYQGSDPVYDYMPGKDVFAAAEVLFTVIYVIEFLLRWLTATKQKTFWKSKQTWLDLCALLPLFFFKGIESINGNKPNFKADETQSKIYFLRLLRVVRVISMSRYYDGCRIMFKAVKDSIGPLKITVSYSEPHYPSLLLTYIPQIH